MYREYGEVMPAAMQLPLYSFMLRRAGHSLLGDIDKGGKALAQRRIPQAVVHQLGKLADTCPYSAGVAIKVMDSRPQWAA